MEISKYQKIIMNLQEFISNYIDWQLCLIIATVGFVLYLIVKAFLAFKRCGSRKNILHKVIITNLKLPLLLLIIVIFINFIIQIVFHELKGSTALAMKQVLPNIMDIKNISIILIVSWYLLRVISGIRQYFNHHDQKLNIAILGQVLQILTIISTVLIIIDKLGLNISGIVTFGGIGGVAAGFAAKDLLSNFFGSLVISLDRPFSVGDRIFSPDKQISGLVMEIGWRVTKILTYEKRPIYIPNSVFSLIIVQNDSRMTNRRIDDFLRIRFEDIEIVNKIVKEVEIMLNKNSDLDQSHGVVAAVNSIGSKIFTLHIYVFTKTIGWSEYKMVKQNMLIKVARIVNSLGASLVFPGATVEVHEKEMYAALAQGEKLV